MITRLPAVRPNQPAPIASASSPGPAFSIHKPPVSKPTPEATESAISQVGRLVSDLEQQRRDIDRLIRQAARGRNFTPAELLVLQARVYAYGQEMEVVSRMVDKTVASVKTTLNTQV